MAQRLKAKFADRVRCRFRDGNAAATPAVFARCQRLQPPEQEDFPSNRHLALNLCLAACPDAKPVPLLAQHALGLRAHPCSRIRPSLARSLKADPKASPRRSPWVETATLTLVGVYADHACGSAVKLSTTMVRLLP